MRRGLLLGAIAIAVFLTTAFQDWLPDSSSPELLGSTDHESPATTSAQRSSLSSLKNTAISSLLANRGVASGSFYECNCSSEKTDTSHTALTLGPGPDAETAFVTTVTTVEVEVIVSPGGSEAYTTSTIIQEAHANVIPMSNVASEGTLESVTSFQNTNPLPTTCVCVPPVSETATAPQPSTFSTVTTPDTVTDSMSAMQTQVSNSPTSSSISNRTSTGNFSTATPGDLLPTTGSTISAVDTGNTTDPLPWNGQSTLQSPQVSVTSANGSQPSSQTVSSLTETVPNTIAVSGTTSITMVVITTVVTLQIPQAPPTTVGASESELGPAASSSPASSVAFTTISAGSMLPTASTDPSGVTSILSSPSSIDTSLSSSNLPITTASLSDDNNFCNAPIIPWCVTPSTTSVVLGVSTVISNLPVVGTSFCACPTCLMPSPLCKQNPPSQSTSCPDGWLCSLTIPYPTLTAWWSLGPFLTWQSDLSTWSINPETLTNTESTRTTDLSWSATLSTSTRRESDGSLILFPLRIWKCVGPLCDPNLGSEWMNRVRCLLALNCNNPFKGVFGFPPPIVPVRPPTGPPSLAYETLPTTIQPSQPSPSTKPTSCSPTPVISCTEVCSTNAVPQATTTTLSEACTQSCFTTTTCSGASTDVTTTLSCTEAITLATVTCSSTVVSQQEVTSCNTSSIVTTGCLDNTVSTDLVCSLNPASIDPSIGIILSSWAAQYPFNPSDPISVSSDTLGTTTSDTPIPAATLTTPLVPTDSSFRSLFSSIESSRSASLASASSTSSISTANPASPATTAPAGTSASSIDQSFAVSSASAAASGNAFYTPPAITASQGYQTCAPKPLPGPVDTKPDQSPNDPWTWFDISRPEFLTTLLQFCTHIGKSNHLGSEFFVYTAAQFGHDIGTVFDRNVTFAVTWNPAACPPTRNENCDAGNSWFGCPIAQDGGVTFTSHPQGTWWNATDGNQCIEAFQNAYMPCVEEGGPAGGNWTQGGWFFDKCLQWSVVSGKQSPTHFWALEGNGGEIMSDVGPWGIL